ncbi:hypothetical protein HKX48_005026 [Thoreauomyces humboldtii]|nr:hypothetical protein HKX48_005026 [Thoreauomyces humboldtii]
MTWTSSHIQRNDMGTDSAVDTQSECDTDLLHDRTIQSNSLNALYQLRPNVDLTTGFAVLKLSNIAWNLSIADVLSYFKPFQIPFGHVAPHFTQAVHIVMNRATGKTQSDCFIEFPTYTDAQRAFDMYNRGILKGRIVVTQWSTQTELMDALFPHRAGHSQESTIMEPDTFHDEVYGMGKATVHPIWALSEPHIFLEKTETL